MSDNTYMDNLNILLDNFLVVHNKEDIEIKKYNADDILIEEGQSVDFFIFLLSGKAKVVQNYENGKRILIQFFNPINILGDIEYITKAHATCTAIAVEPILSFKLKFSDIDKNYTENIVFYKFLLEHMSKKLMNTSMRNSLHVIYPVKTRLASYLLSTIDINNETTVASMSDLSDYLGTSYRHLNRSINDLIKLDIIKKEKKNISIINKEKLIKTARGNIYEDNKFD